MRQFHPLTIERLERETADSMRVALSVPAEIRPDFAFLPGQHLPVQATIDGRIVRRTYSICSVPGQWPLEIGVRLQPGGVFSGYVGRELKVGDELLAMPPFGQFHATLDPAAAKNYLAFAAGSGITPVLSILRATLETEASSRFILFYGNRSQRTTMFIDDLYALKNRFAERLQLYFIFSREEQEFPIFSGRLDAARAGRLWEAFCGGFSPDEAYLCGPDTLIDTLREALAEQGMAASSLHAERYGASLARRRPRPQALAPVGRRKPSTDVTVIMDGHRKTFDMTEDDDNIVDAAAARGIELPYSCKAGVCATCRTYLREGEVRMATHHGLEAWEVEKGYILACQSRPRTGAVVLDYDEI